ncbi:hypothetical protein B0H14DRAFT_3471054 [Mycena olivaceomarginata]|nr:hypothetical protein B0H14DRAFT_3471054 [Mycena olivaceomarginata]
MKASLRSWSCERITSAAVPATVPTPLRLHAGDARTPKGGYIRCPAANDRVLGEWKEGNASICVSREELSDVQMVGALRGPSPHARMQQTQGARGTRSRPGLMPACSSSNEVPAGSLALEGALASPTTDARNTPASTYSSLHDHGMHMRTIGACPASSPVEDTSRTRCSYKTRAPKAASRAGSCRPGVTWKRARTAHHHPEQPKSVRVYMGVM